MGSVWANGGSVLETCLSLFLSFQIMNIMWCLLYESSFNYPLYFNDEETEVQGAFQTPQTTQWGWAENSSLVPVPHALLGEAFQLGYKTI